MSRFVPAATVRAENLALGASRDCTLQGDAPEETNSRTVTTGTPKTLQSWMQSIGLRASRSSSARISIARRSASALKPRRRPAIWVSLLLHQMAESRIDDVLQCFRLFVADVLRPT